MRTGDIRNSKGLAGVIAAEIGSATESFLSTCRISLSDRQRIRPLQTLPT